MRDELERADRYYHLYSSSVFHWHWSSHFHNTIPQLNLAYNEREVSDCDCHCHSECGGPIPGLHVGVGTSLKIPKTYNYKHSNKNNTKQFLKHFYNGEKDKYTFISMISFQNSKFKSVIINLQKWLQFEAIREGSWRQYTSKIPCYNHGLKQSISKVSEYHDGRVMYQIFDWSHHVQKPKRAYPQSQK